MGPPLPRWTNTVSHVLLAGLVGAIVGVPALLMVTMRSAYVTNVGNPVVQPVDFDHRHHVRDDGLDCRYCHDSAEKLATAGMPSTDLCLNCHSQLWTSSPLLGLVRRSHLEGKPIPWKRVHVLPDHVQFHHGIHVSKGVGCAECHGRVDLMPAVAKSAPLTMAWCLDCHRNPAPRLRPASEITSMTWKSADPAGEGAALAKANQVRSLVHCSTCHR
jgi:hypothetical protein